MTFDKLRAEATALLGNCMQIDSVSRWRGELVQRCHDLLKAITFVEADDEARRVDDEEKRNGK